MFGARQPFNFAQYYTTQGAFGTDPDPGSWHAPASPYAPSCARSGSYEDWSLVAGLGQQPASPACSHTSSPGTVQVSHGYSYPLHPSLQQGGYMGPMTPPSVAEFGAPGGLQGHTSHFVFPDLPGQNNASATQQGHSPDSGVALSCEGVGVGESESPSQQQQQQQHPPLVHPGATQLVSHYTTATPLEQSALHTRLLGSGSRPQPARSPFEWIKKPSYQIQVQPGKTRTKDKYRVVYTDHQRLELEKEFHYNRYISIGRKSQLAGLLVLSERQVKIWFQNRRAKERKQDKKRKEMDRKEFISSDYMLKLEPDAVLSLCTPTSCTG